MLYKSFYSRKPDVVPVKVDMDSKYHYMISAKGDICSIMFNWDQIASQLWEDATCMV